MNREQVERTTILRCVVGSEAYGLSTGGSDRDEKGVCIERFETFTGFETFEQFEHRDAEIREGKKDAPSQPGDLDLTIYGLRKFLRLALRGNPSVIELLYMKNCIRRDALGAHLQELAPNIISRQCGRAFLGYMQAQKMRLMGEIGQKKVNRPELEEKYGYDTKYAMHIVRLGFQGVELLSTGMLTLPLTGASRDLCLAIKKGEVPLQDVLSRAGALERELKDLLDTSPLPEVGNTPLVEDWMISTYWGWWKAERFMIDYHKPEELVVH